MGKARMADCPRRRRMPGSGPARDDGRSPSVGAAHVGRRGQESYDARPRLASPGATPPVSGSTLSGEGRRLPPIPGRRWPRAAARPPRRAAGAAQRPARPPVAPRAASDARPLAPTRRTLAEPGPGSRAAGRGGGAPGSGLEPRGAEPGTAGSGLGPRGAEPGTQARTSEARAGNITFDALGRLYVCSGNRDQGPGSPTAGTIYRAAGPGSSSPPPGRRGSSPSATRLARRFAARSRLVNVDGSRIKRFKIKYDGGLRLPRLKRDEGLGPDILKAIAEPR